MEVLKAYKETVDSRWMFSSPMKPDPPRYPTTVTDILTTHTAVRNKILTAAVVYMVCFESCLYVFAIRIAEIIAVKTSDTGIE